ncbi:ATP-grasp superfamily protein [Venturia nashicola]|uniref:ATP-grasp superfamily protein n=1 Tax=Venturia nashicola TaxID=86259 RepID=A0A4Z1PP17_9PEZI|nr:ATP-grasp superfamily protein [Venturia nashicola]TLD39699.1 ATP-grasp superfamily protein [Venturia nashicola]
MSSQSRVVAAFHTAPEDKPTLVQVSFESRPETLSPSNTSQPRYWALDVVLFPSPEGSSHENQSTGIIQLDTSTSPQHAFLADGLKTARQWSAPTALRFIFPAQDGQVTRSDFLEQRLEYCEFATRAVSFVSPLQALTSIALCQVTTTNIANLLTKSIGGILTKLASNDPSPVLTGLDKELSNKLSFPWIVPGPLQRKRVAWVQGRENIDVSRRAYEAARALGITLVILENEGHWLQDEKWSDLRESFVPLDIEIDDGLAQRIVDAVRAYSHPIDGIVTISDFRLPAIAKACEMLGLPTAPYEAYAIAKDKGKTRMLEPDAHESFAVSSVEELQSALASRLPSPLQFPLIVKPCHGYNSDCVSKVWNERDLAEAVRRASARHADAKDANTNVVIEPYIDGPEVDINIVLLDGEMISCEISDEFPSDGDAEDADFYAGFQETKTVMPSSLPENEKQVLRESLKKSILRQGFQSGVFHCEARVRNSRVRYASNDGILDLQTKPDSPNHEISAYLHEINARPPGYLETAAVSMAYGLDYFAMRLLLSLGAEENTRVRALAQPFLSGPQFHLSITIMPQTRAGIMKTEDAAESFLDQHPDIRKQVVDYETQMKKGAVLEGPAAASLWWIGYFSLISRESRQKCLETVDFVHKNFSYELE